mmetsp:Transcript_5596/g.20018  ORF Transcript_5596/g.20018 Transcript_5596/m.20018 type:complete len:489 (-) Transcript_5596:222-1688(-)
MTAVRLRSSARNWRRIDGSQLPPWPIAARHCADPSSIDVSVGNAPLLAASLRPSPRGGDAAAAGLAASPGSSPRTDSSCFCLDNRSSRPSSRSTEPMSAPLASIPRLAADAPWASAGAARLSSRLFSGDRTAPAGFSPPWCTYLSTLAISAGETSEAPVTSDCRNDSSREAKTVVQPCGTSTVHSLRSSVASSGNATSTTAAPPARPSIMRSDERTKPMRRITSHIWLKSSRTVPHAPNFAGRCFFGDRSLRRLPCELTLAVSDALDSRCATYARSSDSADRRESSMPDTMAHISRASLRRSRSLLWLFILLRSRSAASLASCAARLLSTRRRWSAASSYSASVVFNDATDASALTTLASAAPSARSTGTGTPRTSTTSDGTSDSLVTGRNSCWPVFGSSIVRSRSAARAAATSRERCSRSTVCACVSLASALLAIRRRLPDDTTGAMRRVDWSFSHCSCRMCISRSLRRSSAVACRRSKSPSASSGS